MLATTVALQTLRELEISGEHRLVRGAMSFLAATYCADQQGWPFVPAAAENAPHAPWWNGVGLATQLSRFHGNPRAEVIAYLYQYPGYLEEDVRDALATAVLEHLDTLLPDVEMHTFLCYQRLVETDALPDRFRRPLLRALKEAAHAIVARDPSRWHGYVVQPISMAATPQSPFADLFRNELPLNLDMLIGQQSAEGGWEPAWSWGDAYPESWPAAKQAWTGMLTVNTLRTLRAYGRL